MYVCIYIHIGMCIHIYFYIHIRTYVYVYVYMHIYVCIYIHTNWYVYIYISIHIGIPGAAVRIGAGPQLAAVFGPSGRAYESLGVLQRSHV